MSQLGREERRRKWRQTSKNGGEEANGPGQGANPFAIEDIGHRFIVSVVICDASSLDSSTR
jgi:hypothetical protein